MSISIRVLSDADLQIADAILKSAFRRPESRVEDLQLYRRIQPDGWFLASERGSAVGMVGATNYGTFAYVGLMAVHQDAQRQGIGFALMQYLLVWLDRHGAPLVVLDASEAGQPLYQKLGFVAYDQTYVFRRGATTPFPERPSGVQVASVRELDELVHWDADVFGADRASVLHALLTTFPGRAFMLRDEQNQVAGYLFAQRNRIGPWVVRRSQDAEVLLQTALSLPYEGAVSVVVPEVNPGAIELLKRYGFEGVRSTCHMGRGPSAPPTQRTKIYGQTSLAIG